MQRIRPESNRGDNETQLDRLSRLLSTLEIATQTLKIIGEKNETLEKRLCEPIKFSPMARSEALTADWKAVRDRGHQNANIVLEETLRGGE